MSEINASWSPVGRDTAFPPQALYKLAASEQLGRGQFGLIDPTTGYASLADGATPGQIPAGVSEPAKFSTTSSVAGAAANAFWIGVGIGMAESTVNGDGFTAADVAKPFWIAGASSVGKLSNYSGSNRSLGGIVLGVDEKGLPYVASGPVPYLLARAALMADAAPGASHSFADAAANTNTAERAIHREKLHGTVTAIEFIGAAVAADNADYVTITVRKRDGAGGAAVTLGTYDSRAANNGAITAFVPASFTLSVVAGALNLLETDIITIEAAKTGAGQILNGTVRVVQKVA